MSEYDESSPQAAPDGLGAGGLLLWESIAEVHSLDPAQVVQLTEACRAKDRLDRLDSLLRGDIDSWAAIAMKAGGDLELKVDAALGQANATANLLKQLLAALRLPDVDSGKRPQQRSARGAYAPKQSGSASGTVSSLERARRRKGA